MGLRSVEVPADNGRPGPGARYHCVHETVEFSSWVLDWSPFRYVSNRYLCAFDPSLSHQETYEITPIEDGCEVRYTTAPMYHPRPSKRAVSRARRCVSRALWDHLRPWFRDPLGACTRPALTDVGSQHRIATSREPTRHGKGRRCQYTWEVTSRHDRRVRQRDKSVSRLRLPFVWAKAMPVAILRRTPLHRM